MTTQTETAIMKDYAAAGGLRTYYEAQGTGDPLVMLHGGFATVEMFGGAFTPLIASGTASTVRSGADTDGCLMSADRSRTRSWPTTPSPSSRRWASDRRTWWAGATAPTSA